MPGSGADHQRPQDHFQQIQSLRDQFIDVANRKDTNGLPCSAAWAAPAAFLTPWHRRRTTALRACPARSAADTVSIPLTLDGDAAFMFRQPARWRVPRQHQATPPDRQFGTTAITTTDPT